MTIEKIKEKLPKYEPILWRWSTNNDGLHPVKIRVTFDRKSKYYSAQYEGEKIFVSPTQWKSMRSENPRGTNRVLSDAVADSLAEAKKAGRLTTANNKPFTFDRFEKNYVHKQVQGGFLKSFEDYLENLKTEGRIGTYVAYNSAYSALKEFKNEKDFNPIELTPDELKKFERHLKSPRKYKTARGREITKSAGNTTVGMYMRAVKVVYNFIADDNPELKEFYPFATKQNDRKRYFIPTSDGHKGEALSADILKKFISIETEPGDPAHEAKLYFLFSFYGNGMNMRDIAHLKYENLKDGAIRFRREKTKRTKSGEGAVLIEVPLSDELNKIIIELSTNDKKGSNFIFPILSLDMDPQTQDNVIRQKIKMINKYLKVLCEENGIPAFTTYSARHSYASLLKSAKVSVEVIRELLGHGDIKTTENYLSRFDIDTKKEANANIDRILKKTA